MTELPFNVSFLSFMCLISLFSPSDSLPSQNRRSFFPSHVRPNLNCNEGHCIEKWKCTENSVINSSSNKCSNQNGGPWVCCLTSTGSLTNFEELIPSELPKYSLFEKNISPESAYRLSTRRDFVLTTEKSSQWNDKSYFSNGHSYKRKFPSERMPEYPIKVPNIDKNADQLYGSELGMERFVENPNITSAKLANDTSYQISHLNFVRNHESRKSGKLIEKPIESTLLGNRNLESSKQLSNEGLERETTELKKNDNLWNRPYQSRSWRTNTNDWKKSTTKTTRKPSNNQWYSSKTSPKFQTSKLTTSSWINPSKNSWTSTLKKSTSVNGYGNTNNRDVSTKSSWLGNSSTIHSKRNTSTTQSKRTTYPAMRTTKPWNNNNSKNTKTSRRNWELTTTPILRTTRSSSNNWHSTKPFTSGWHSSKTSMKPTKSWSNERVTNFRKSTTETWRTGVTSRSYQRTTTKDPATRRHTTNRPKSSTVRVTKSSKKTTLSTRSTTIRIPNGNPKRENTPFKRQTTKSSINNRGGNSEKYSTASPLPDINNHHCGIRDMNPNSANSGRGTNNRYDDQSDEVIIFPKSREKSATRQAFQRIVGGEEAEPFSWPWVAALYKVTSSGGNRFLCAGSLINEYFVLTAAHVFTPVDLRSSSFVVMLGTHTGKEAVAEYHVMNVLQHPKYEHRYYYNDIALLRLERPVVFNDFVVPVCLPGPSMPFFKDRDLVGKQVTVMGWGDDAFGGVTSRVLQEATFPIVSRENCNASYFQVVSNRFPRGITHDQLCAGSPNGGKDACQGDSGVPLTTIEQGRYTQVGIVSFGYKCGDKDYPGVYTKVSSYLNWIAENARCEGYHDYDYNYHSRYN